MSERRETSMNMRSAVWGSKGMRRGNAGLAAVAVTALHLGGEHGFQEPLVGPVFGARPARPGWAGLWPRPVVPSTRETGG